MTHYQAYLKALTLIEILLVVTLGTLAMAAFGHATSADDYLGFYQRGQLYSQQLADFHDRYDFWLTPTLAMQPAAIGASATPAWQQNALKVILKLRASKLVMKSGLVEP